MSEIIYKAVVVFLLLSIALSAHETKSLLGALVNAIIISSKERLHQQNNNEVNKQ